MGMKGSEVLVIVGFLLLGLEGVGDSLGVVLAHGEELIEALAETGEFEVGHVFLLAAPHAPLLAHRRALHQHALHEGLVGLPRERRHFN